MIVIPLLTGQEDIKKRKHGFQINKLTSSVTLLKSGNKNLLIDSGYYPYWKKLNEKLKREKLTPNDIDIIVHTHLHFDHTNNDNRFSKAQILTDNHVVWDNKTRAVNIYEKNQPKFLKNIVIVPTPGHTADHNSFLVKDKNGIKWIMAGDAFHEEAIIKESVPAYYNEALYWQNAKKIISLADFIVPGHGKIINKDKFSLLQKIINKHL